MTEKCKPILGLSGSARRGVFISFNIDAKHRIIQDYLSSDCTKNEIWEKHTGRKKEHGAILRWMRELGYQEKSSSKTVTFAPKPTVMQSIEKTDNESESFESLQLKKRIEELEKQLKESEMKSIAYTTMIDIAEKELNINIRKKYNSKPLNR